MSDAEPHGEWSARDGIITDVTSLLMKTELVTRRRNLTGFDAGLLVGRLSVALEIITTMRMLDLLEGGSSLMAMNREEVSSALEAVLNRIDLLADGQKMYDELVEVNRTEFLMVGTDPVLIHPDTAHNGDASAEDAQVQTPDLTESSRGTESPQA